MGYWTVKLHREGEKRTVRTHILVLEAFVGPRPEGLVSCHGPNGLDDNSPGNLRWDTQAENLAEAINHNAAKTHCKRGHEFTPENTRINPTSGARVCRQCAYEGNKARLAI